MLLVSGPEKDLADHGLLVNKKSGPVNPHIIAAVQLFFPPDSVFVDYTVARIGEEGEGEAELLFKFPVALFIVGADTHDRKTFPGQKGIVVAKIAGLHSARGSVVLGIEIKYKLLPFIIGKGNRLSILILAGE